jgi:DNA helicase IV
MKLEEKEHQELKDILSEINLLKVDYDNVWQKLKTKELSDFDFNAKSLELNNKKHSLEAKFKKFLFDVKIKYNVLGNLEIDTETGILKTEENESKSINESRG